jgi:predicted ATPase/class 3 adenylate cyclase
MLVVTDLRQREWSPEGAALAFLLTDIEGSSVRWERYPKLMRSALARHDTAIAMAVSGAGGRVFKSIGDGIYAVFPTVRQAIEAALAAQLTLLAEDFSSVDGLAVRMAVHIGPAEARAGDYFGPTMNRAARLLNVAQGGQILLSGVAASMAAPAELPAGVRLQDLGERRLKNLALPEAVFQLVHARLRTDFPALHVADSRPHNLPQWTTSFVGREGELADIVRLIRQHRLVTLAGAGGIGKTRLSLRAGSELLGRFADGVWFVELASFNQPAQIGEAVAALFNISLGDHSSVIDIVASYLRRKHVLLILDNCEHVKDGVAIFVDALLRQTESLAIMVSSREVLGVAGEQIFPMPGLAMPESAAGLTLADAMGYSAIKLFVERARGAVPGFTLDETALPAVVVICQRLDGMALAIELAAARLRMLSPAELLNRLDDRFALLVAPRGGTPARQQTLRALLDWSYDLLSAQERLALSRLSVFGGGFTLAAAQAVIADATIDPAAIFDLISGLLDKSMLTSLPRPAAESRFRLLETTRHYAAEKLAAYGEVDLMQQRLADWLIALYGTAASTWPTMPTDDWLSRFAPDLDNLRASLTWLFRPGGETERGLTLMSQTAEFWRDLALEAERRRWLQEAITRIGPQTPKPVAARIWLDLSFSFAGGAFGDKRKLDPALRAYDLYRESADHETICLAAGRIVACLARPGENQAARPYADEIYSTLPSIKPTKRRAWLLNILAVNALFVDDHEHATLLLNEALGISRHFRDHVGIQVAGLNLAETRFAQGYLLDAADLAEEVASSCRQSGNMLDLTFVLSNLAAYNLALGRFGVARDAIGEALPLLADLGVELVLASCLECAALLAAETGDYIAAAQLAGYSSAFMQLHDIARQSTEQATWAGLITLLDQAEAHGQFSAAARAAAMAQGASWSTTRALDLAAQIASAHERERPQHSAILQAGAAG